MVVVEQVGVLYGYVGVLLFGIMVVVVVDVEYYVQGIVIFDCDGCIDLVGGFGGGECDVDLFGWIVVGQLY